MKNIFGTSKSSEVIEVKIRGVKKKRLRNRK
jgi:hypothetical protein